MDPRCQITLLGPLRLVQAHQTTTRFRTQKAASLLAYLALHLGPQAREQIVDLFWPDMEIAAGRSNLSTTLSSLRRHLEPPGIAPGSVLITTHAQVGLNPAAVSTDVDEFERLGTQAHALAADPPRAAVLLERAMALAAGGFQPGNYQDWAVREAERLQAMVAEVLERLGAIWEAEGRFTEAVTAAHRRVQADPYAEDARLALVRCLARGGRQGEAREAARAFDKFFRQEFGTGPASATQREMERLLDAPISDLVAGSAPVLPLSAPPLPAPPLSLSASDKILLQPKPAAAAPLPFWLSRFIGRETETAQLAALLLPPKSFPPIASPHLPPRPRRLCTIIGPGGAGKTRMAVEFARAAAERFGHWCGFVPLADLSAPDQIPARIAQSLRLPPAAETGMDQAATFFGSPLSHPPAVLILDNWEHLLAGEEQHVLAAEMVQDLLDRAPTLTVLCTSRRPLGLQGEQLLPLLPLAVPDAPEDLPASSDLPTLEWTPEALGRLQNIAGVRLYLDRAQAARPDFGLTSTNASAVAALCRTLEGSPLALELAASWVRLLPPRKMWERMQQGQEMPEGRHTNLPPRQRSVSAALEWSWRLLPEEQKRLLARLSVFRGGWSIDAAEMVCEEPNALGLLAALQEASLVCVTADGASQTEAGHNSVGERLRLQETVRAFGRHKLEQMQEWQTRLRHHALFFANMAQEAGPALRGPEQKRWMDTLDTEHDNLRAALDWWDAPLDCAPDADKGLQMATALAPFWRARSYLREGHERLRRLLARTPGVDASAAVRAAALNRAGELATLRAEYADAEAFHAEARQLAQGGDDVPAEADALLGLGTVNYWRQEYTYAGELFTQSLVLRRERRERWADAGHRDWGEAAIFHSLGNLALRQDALEEAQRQMEQALLLRRSCDPLGVASTVGALGQIAFLRGDYRQAARYQCETMCLFHAAGQRWTAALCLSNLSSIAQVQGQPARATCLLSASDALRRRFHFPIPPAEQSSHEAHISELRASLSDTAFAKAWAEGQALSWEQMVAQAHTFQT